MNSAGRNDPCPCGSGKKYKKCHMLIEAASQTDRDPRYESFRAMRNEADEQVIRALRGLLLPGEAERFIQTFESPPFLSTEQVRRLRTNPDAARHMETQIPFAMLRAYRSPEGKFLGELAMARHPSRFTQEQKDYLRSLGEAPVTFVQAREFFPEQGVVIAEDVFDHEIYRIHDYAMSRNPMPHVIGSGRLLRYPHAQGGHGFVMDPLGQTAYDPRDKEDLIETLARMAGDPKLRGLTLKQALRAKPLLCYWAGLWKFQQWLEQPVPVLKNRDGDSLVLIEEEWLVADVGAALTGLHKWRDTEEETGEDGPEFIWLNEKDTILGQVYLNLKTDRLKVSVNSYERYRRLRRKLDRIPGLSLLDRKETVPNLQNSGKGSDDLKPTRRMKGKRATEAGFSSEALAQIGKEFFEKWMADTLDSPVPVLDNRSPRESCQTPEGRRKVREWLDEYESHLARSPRDPLMRAFDIDEVRRRLGLIP